MVSKSRKMRTTRTKNLANIFAYWAIGLFVIKLIIISNIAGGAWYAADGVNYVKGVEALINEGIFSAENNLTYWPAGYPLFIYFLTIFGTNWVLTTVAIVQSALFSFSIYFFAKQILATRLKNYAYIAFMLILLNPTLSLSSLSVGYESIAASGSLLILGIIAKDLQEKNSSKFLNKLILVSAISGFLVFIQPRLLIAGVFVLFLWILQKQPKKIVPVFLSLSLLVLLFFPATLVYRNEKAVGVAAVSTNLGVTMDIGAGDLATGRYDSKNHGVKCDIKTNAVGKADSQRVICVLKWYVDNPDKSLKLFYNKTVSFWSPWSGSIAYGTMNFNPWLKINPVTSIARTTEGVNLITSTFGRLISILWILGQIILLFYGFTVLYRAGRTERTIGLIAIYTVGASWIITLFSIGDHRFRLPIMGMSLFLQAIGVKTIFKGGKAPMVESPALR
jgi:hypothetical protein